MISLDQVYLLEQKVESAVTKIQQLQDENAALRKKCEELTNALSAKSEQLSTIEQDQGQIESGILKALDRLNSIENSVLKAAGQAAFTQGQFNQVETAHVEAAVKTQSQAAEVQQKNEIQQNTVNTDYPEGQTIAEAQALANAVSQNYNPQESQNIQQNITEKTDYTQNQPNFDSMQPAFDYNQTSNNSIPEESDEEFVDDSDDIQDDEQNPGFDIF
ncbi:MAG: cell division protein ZapB [Treponema sp.]|nr:cell division protein ZapB [Treponema sp.]